jgi:EAL domain-containing protein (putative c-di-GMP-specific phosphodiesterase class I)
VARLGGDEFVIVAQHVENEPDATQFAQRVLNVISQPIPIGQQEFFATCSIGISIYPRDGDSPSDLLKHADAAMYTAKESGRNAFRFYAAEMNARAQLRIELEAALRRAIVRNEFVVHYQPQMDLASGGLVGFEALVRWQHPKHGLMAPNTFIGLAEETGLIVQIGNWVLREACRQAKFWQAQGLGDFFVAVNLSARQFKDGNLTQLVDTALQDMGLDARFLELEITESLLMENPEAAADTLRRLRARGVRLSIDDFGTGYSSLGYLKRFPLDKLKIDSSFVRDITSEPDDAAIATAIIAMAHRLKLKVVAEGVETEGQLDYLRQHCCDAVQGYYFSRPLTARDCLKMLKSRPSYQPPLLTGA